MDYNFGQIKLIIIYEIYQFYKKSTNNNILVEKEILGLIGDYTSPRFCINALQALQEEDYLNWNAVDNSYDITPVCINEVEHGLADQKSFIYKFAYGDSETASETDADSPATGIIPASDRIVTLDDNNPALNETLSALRQLSADSSKSNELGNLCANPEDRILITSQIDAGIKLLELKRVIPSVVIKMLTYPVNFIREKMPDAALGILANKAWDWLMKLLENSP